ncbi:MAG: hypothetical protein ABIH63_00510 [archaeon]
MDRREFLSGLVIYGGATVLASTSIPLVEYIDLPGFFKYQTGRTKNSIASVVAGLVGQKLYGNSEINLEIQKKFFPDARVTGHTTPSSVDTYVDLALTSARFIAQKNELGSLEGEVHKSEINWKVKQISEDSYKIARWGPKFDGILKLKLENDNILGLYIRKGSHFDWKVKGKHNHNGDTKIEIDGPLNLGIILEGKITKK